MNIYVKADRPPVQPVGSAGGSVWTVQQNLAVVGTTAEFCSVKRFVYAALLLCASDSRCQQLVQT